MSKVKCYKRRRACCVHGDTLTFQIKSVGYPSCCKARSRAGAKRGTKVICSTMRSCCVKVHQPLSSPHTADEDTRIEADSTGHFAYGVDGMLCHKTVAWVHSNEFSIATPNDSSITHHGFVRQICREARDYGHVISVVNFCVQIVTRMFQVPATGWNGSLRKRVFRKKTIPAVEIKRRRRRVTSRQYPRTTDNTSHVVYVTI
jgi:hypothetical protein